MSLVRENILKIEPYIPGKQIAEVRREFAISGEIIKLASNENLLGPSPKAVNAIRKNLNDINYYPEGGCTELKDALAKKHAVNPDNIIVGNGSNEILELIAEAFINPGDEIIISNLTFAVYKIIALFMNAPIIQVDLKNYTYDLDEISNKITEKTKIIFICNPNNPTGTMNSETEVGKFLNNVPPHVIVAFDEAYFEYVIRSDFPDTLKYLTSSKKIFILRTFSKIYGLAGLRIGYGIADAELIEVLNRVRQPFNVNFLAQIAALAGLKDEKHVAESIKINNEGKLILYKAFLDMNIKYVETSANFIFLDLGKSNKQIVQNLLKKGIIVRDIGETYIRVTIGLPNQIEKFINAFKMEVIK